MTEIQIKETDKIEEIEMKEQQEEYKKLGLFKKMQWNAIKRKIRRKIKEDEEKQKTTEEDRQKICTALKELNEILIIIDDNGKEMTNEEIEKLKITEAREMLRKSIETMEKIEN